MIRMNQRMKNLVSTIRGLNHGLYFFLIIFFFIMINIAIKDMAYGLELSGDFTSKYIWHYANESSILYNEENDTDNTGYLFLNPKLETRYKNSVAGFFDFEIDYNSTLNSDEDTRAEDKEIKINELYSKINLSDYFILKAGKQVLKWGTGYAYNPINFLNPQKKPIEQESNTIEGINLIDLNIIFSYLSISVIGVPSNVSEESGSGVIISTSDLIPYTDLYIAGYYSKRDKFRWGGAFSSNPFAQLAYLDGLLIWSEAGFYPISRRYELERQSITHPETFEEYEYYSMKEMPERFYWSYDGGLSFEFPVIQTILFTEYYYISDGYAKEDYYNLSKNINNTSSYDESIDETEQDVYENNIAWLPELTRFGKNSRHYLSLGIEQPSLSRSFNMFTDTLGFNISLLLNLLDQSYILIGALSSSVIENSNISLEAKWAMGEQNTEFDNLQDKLRLGLSISIGF